MREIKFRAWYNAYSEYFNVELINFVEKKAVLKSIVGNQNFRTHVDFTNFDLEQFSGMKDKNGVEIYEGDMVIYDFVNGGKDPVVGIVKYKTECASYGVVPLAYMDSIILFADLDLNAPLEVVGNIHDKENKE